MAGPTAVLTDLYGPEDTRRPRLIPFVGRQGEEVSLHADRVSTNAVAAMAEYHGDYMIPVGRAVAFGRESTKKAAITYGAVGLIVGALGAWGIKSLFSGKKPVRKVKGRKVVKRSKK